jgi:8-oxo-dGTP diphosphatase
MIEVSVGILHRNGLVLACQRKHTSRYPLKWEFPGGKLEPGETPVDALVRELREELGVTVEPGEKLLTQEWDYGDKAYRVHYYSVVRFDGEPDNFAFETIMWVTPEELTRMDVLEGNKEIVEEIAERGKGENKNATGERRTQKNA